MPSCTAHDVGAECFHAPPEFAEAAVRAGQLSVLVKRTSIPPATNPLYQIYTYHLLDGARARAPRPTSARQLMSMPGS